MLPRRIAFLFLFMTLLTSCIKLNQEIWIQQDGTAKLRAELSVKTDEPLTTGIENPFKDLVDTGDPNLVNLKVDQFQENGYWYFVSEFESKSFDEFAKRDNFGIAKLTQKASSTGSKILTLVTAPPNPEDMASMQPYLEDQLFTTIVHAPYVLKTNGQVTGQDAVSTTVQWQIPMEDALLNPGKQLLSLEYTLEKPSVVPTHQIVSAEVTATPVATKLSTTPVSPTPTAKAIVAASTIKYDSPLLRSIVANPPTFSDDFSQNDGRWQPSSNKQVAMKIEKGLFTMIAQKGDFALWRAAQAELSDFLIEVDTTIPPTNDESYVGVIFRYVDDTNFYQLYISNQGNYVVLKLVNNEWQVVVEPKSSSAINVGKNVQNRVSVAGIGASFQIAINGTLVEEFVDETFQHGDIGFAMTSAEDVNITAAFDNLKFWNVLQFPPDSRLMVTTGRKLSNLSYQEMLDLADDYYFHGYEGQSLIVYDAAIKQYHKEAAYVGRGNAYRLQDKHDLAMKDFEQALKINPNYAPAYRGIGAVYDAKEDPFKALENINQAIALDPSYSLAYYFRGLIYWGQGSMDAALADYSKAIEIDPTNSELYYNRGRFYAAQENRFAALADFNKAIDIYPQDASYYAERSEVYEQNEEYQLALIDYNKATALNPENAEYYTQRGHIFYDNLKEYPLAWVNYDQAVQLAPEDAWAYYFRGDASALLQNHRSAIADYEKSVELAPDLALPYYKRAVAYEELSEQQKAYDDYLKFLELDEGDSRETRHACEQANWLHFTLSKDMLSALFNVIAQPCNRFPTESVSSPGLSGEEKQPNSCNCISKEVFDGYNLIGEPVYHSELECWDDNGHSC